ncbi:MAG: ASKHA domain-containing protein [Bacteroidota bacterium]
MNHKIKIHNKGRVEEYDIHEGANLLEFIRENTDGGISAPCGGNGTCGKCKVEIKDEGHVTSCLYYVSKDIELIMPDEQEMKIMSDQYKFTKQYWVNPGKAAGLATIPYGLAIDIGTTTIAYYIVNMLFGTVVDVITKINPQSQYGADVISRISYGKENENGIDNLQSVLVNSINDVLEGYCKNSDLTANDFVKVSIVGNPTMLHQILAIDAISIAHSPFKPVFTETKNLSPADLSININPEGDVVLLPALSGYVGADIIAGLASIDRDKIGKTFLFIDIGTNGEMVLVTPEKTLSCATAAGPAFEGANISNGMGAVPGAISKFNMDSYDVVGDVEPIGICGSGLIDVVGELLKNDIIGMDGNISEDFVVYKSGSNTVSLTQKDLREVQLAKSSIASGVKRMLAKAGIDENAVDNILLAGGFGNYIDIENAIKIGLLPDLPLDKYIQVGNTAGTGSVIAVKSQNFIDDMEKMIDEMEYIELSSDPEFEMEFAMNMFF